MTDDVVGHRLLAGAVRILAAKLAISESLPSGYFHDPALVIMLQLFAHPDPKSIKHSTLCNGVPGVPFSVCTRWVAVLENDGIVDKEIGSIGEGDPFVSLTPYGAETVCALVVAVGRRLHIDVIAEGIENQEQRDLLVKLGCNGGQGYMFGRPEPAERRQLPRASASQA